MKITTDFWKTDYQTSTGGSSTAYVEAVIDNYGSEYLLGFNKHTDEFLLLKYEGDSLKEVYSEGN